MAAEASKRAFWVKAAAALIVVTGLFGVLPNFYTFGIQGNTSTHSLKGSLFITDRTKGLDDLLAGDYVAFETDHRQAPFFKPGRVFAKRVVAVHGDVVTWEDDALLVNGEKVTDIKPSQLKKWLEAGHSQLSEERVLDREVVAIGDHPDSLDSRFFGALSSSDIVGEVFLLW